jgi:hypothetical protein
MAQTEATIRDWWSRGGTVLLHTGRLVVDLVEGGPETNSASDLLEVGLGSPGPWTPRQAEITRYG